MSNSKMKFESSDMTAKNIDRIAALFPNCITEMLDEEHSTSEKKVYKRAVNFELLKQMLSPDVVDGDEAYEFTWVGKKAAIVEANKPIRKTLRPRVAESKDWDTTENLYIEGDNLEVLKLLQESYLGKVKMIYIDPPYNTGNDFIYADDFMRSQEEENEQMGMYDEDENRLFKNTDTNGRFHSDWCSMIYSRLMLARNLLTDDGMIFISIDENEITNLRKICNEVFGSEQFVAQITLLCNPKGRSQDKYIANCHEYLLIYSRTVLPVGSVSIPKSDEDIEKDYPLVDSDGKPYRELELRNTHRDFGRFNRQNLWYPLYVQEDGSVCLNPSSNTETVYPVWDDGFEGCWTWGKDKAEKYLHLLVGKRISGKLKIYRKAYAYADNSAPLKQVKSIWNDNAFFTEKGQTIANALFGTKSKLFQAPKAVALIRQCILMSQEKEAIVLDFFSGSATTAHAVMQLNAEDGGHRKFIMVQLPEKCDETSEAYKAGYKNICEIGKERIRRAGEKLLLDVTSGKGNINGEGWGCGMPTTPEDRAFAIKNILDVGFRVLKLDDTNMKDVYYAPDDYDQGMLAGLESNIKDDRTDLDLLFGCLNDWGLPLSLPYKSEQIDGCTVHTYNDGDLIACFDANIPESVVKEIAQRKPLRAVFRDSGFASSPEKINVFEIFKLYMPEDANDISKRVRVI